MTDFCHVYLSSYYYVDEMMNLEDNGIYDLGVVVLFNGEGIINNEPVESGVKIEEVGYYNLKVVGNNETKSLSFEVKDLSVKEGIKQIENNASNDNTINLDNDLKVIKSENVKVDNEYNYEFNDQVKVKPIIYILITLIISILISLLICFKKPIKKENKI